MMESLLRECSQILPDQRERVLAYRWRRTWFPPRFSYQGSNRSRRFNPAASASSSQLQLFPGSRKAHGCWLRRLGYCLTFDSTRLARLRHPRRPIRRRAISRAHISDHYQDLLLDWHPIGSEVQTSLRRMACRGQFSCQR